jgi:hypothetical protein
VTYFCLNVNTLAADAKRVCSGVFSVSTLAIRYQQDRGIVMEFGTIQKSVSNRDLHEDRRNNRGGTRYIGPDRRQFSDARVSDNYEALELAEAIDTYKLTHRRKFITFEELHDVITGLGYRKSSDSENEE